jgi:Xaa-Pro aminopeptidase
MAFLGELTRDYRYKLMRALMDRAGLDALAFTSADFFQFATNFSTDVQVWERPIVCIVPRDGAPFALMNELSTNHWRYAAEDRRLWVSDAHFYAEHPRISARLPLLPQWANRLADLLAEKGLANARIGADSATGNLVKAVSLLPKAKLETPLAQIRALRWVKSAEEIELMRQLAALSDWVQERYRENIRPGRTVHELDMSMATLMGQEAARRFPGENLEILRCWTLSGPASAAPHGDGRQVGATIERGHGLINLIIPRLNGLVIENERTWFCGKPTPEQERYFEVARAANEACLEAAVTGRPVCGIDEAAQSVIEKAGCAEFIFHRTGHGMGTLGHEFPEDMAFNQRPLLTDEVYSAEPGVYVFGLGGFRKDDTVVVGPVPEVLTRSPGDLKSQTII